MTPRTASRATSGTTIVDRAPALATTPSRVCSARSTRGDLAGTGGFRPRAGGGSRIGGDHRQTVQLAGIQDLDDADVRQHGHGPAGDRRQRGAVVERRREHRAGVREKARLFEQHLRVRLFLHVDRHRPPLVGGSREATDCTK